MMSAIRRVIIDAGHGSVNRSTMDDSQALSRKYVYPDGFTVYEGDINRLYARELSKQLCDSGFITNYTVHPNDHTDVSLTNRVRKANKYNPKDSYFISIHCNASFTHTAHGLEGFTTRGDNNSDIVMRYILKQYLNDNEWNTRIRSDMRDGDLDKEVNFKVIRGTRCKSGLIEIDFYDNRLMYDKLIDNNHIVWWCSKFVRGLEEYNERYGQG